MIIDITDPTEARKKIGAIMRQARESKGLTATALARQLMVKTGKSISSNLINKLEASSPLSYQIDSLLLAMAELGVQIEIIIPDESK